MKLDKPTLLWIRLAGPACGSGNRRDDHRTSYLVRLIHEQISSHRFVVLEGNVRSQGWNLRAIQELGRSGVLFESMHVWCRYQPEIEDACSAVTRIWTSVELPSCDQCLCKPDRMHFTVKHFADATSIESSVLLHATREIHRILSNANDKQPELSSPTRLSSLMSTTTTAKLNTPSHMISENSHSRVDY